MSETATKELLSPSSAGAFPHANWGQLDITATTIRIIDADWLPVRQLDEDARRAVSAARLPSDAELMLIATEEEPME